MSGPAKRSVTIAGHRTSVSMEPEFWSALRHIADEDGHSLSELLTRIEDAQRFIDIGQLAISPQCGFASGISGNALTEDEQWCKLEVMQRVAEKVWG